MTRKPETGCAPSSSAGSRAESRSTSGRRGSANYWPGSARPPPSPVPPTDRPADPPERNSPRQWPGSWCRLSGMTDITPALSGFVVRPLTDADWPAAKAVDGLAFGYQPDDDFL